MSRPDPSPPPTPQVADLVADPAAVTRWLQSRAAADEAVTSARDEASPPARDADPTVDRLFALLYDDLRTIARSQMRREAPDHTLSATALAHEAWFRLSGQRRTQWRNRGHFLAVAATMMRRILVNHAEANRAAKRGADLVTLTFDDASAPAAVAGKGPDVIAVNDALLALEAVDARAARVVELKFFGGLEHEEIAEVLGVSLATVKRDWTVARAFLNLELAGG